jgi:dipeptidase D
LKGGHSGDEIHLGLANSIKLLTRLLWTSDKKFNIRVSRFEGGNLRNAIPRDAYADIIVPAENYDQFERYVFDFQDMVKKEYAKTEPHLNINVSAIDRPRTIVSRKTQKKLLNALLACPHGVVSWSKEIENLVETSTNLAAVKFIEKNNIQITTSQRSSVESAKETIANTVESVFDLAGASIVHSGGYPGWSPNMNSRILNVTRDSYMKLFGKEPEVKAIHAGLECGLFLEKYPGLDMISFGPTIKRAHSPDEQLHVLSTNKFWELLIDVLEKIPPH